MKKIRHKPKGKPHGATYADILAEKLQRMIDEVDEDYAYEKRRRKAEQVTGEKLEYYIGVELKKSRERMV